MMTSLILIILGIALLCLSMIGIVICMAVINRVVGDIIEGINSKTDTF